VTRVARVCARAVYVCVLSDTERDKERERVCVCWFVFAGYIGVCVCTQVCVCTCVYVSYPCACASTHYCVCAVCVRERAELDQETGGGEGRVCVTRMYTTTFFLCVSSYITAII